MINEIQLKEDLSLFADLGTEPPILMQKNDGLHVEFVRDGQKLNLNIESSGKITETYDGFSRKHLDFKSLLASTTFADLGKWADSQASFLKARISDDNIPVQGRLSRDENVADITGSLNLLDDAILNSGANSHRVLVTLVDGPAGIGKTTLLRQIAYKRAAEYRETRRPIILHVESRGRMLQNLTDLMAFSLQTLRLRVTYDQVPVLVRHGLVTLAIDGFDELGDPSGYDMAWAQVNDLITSARGNGSIVLSGRETFIGEGRMKTALNTIDTGLSDRLQTFSLLPPTANVAKNWLMKKGWSEDSFKNDRVASIFEDGSYALRPFFLKELANGEVAKSIEMDAVGDLLQFLVEKMIEREASKFGDDVEAITNLEQRKLFVRRFLEETARDMADNQSDAIPGDTLGWISEVVAADIVSPALVGILKNRASVVAFLETDDRRGYRRFTDDQIGNYFLAYATLKSINDGELPKHVRRNILGLEFLENFSSAMRSIPQSEVDCFVNSAISQIDRIADYDRSRRNLATLVIAMLSVQELSHETCISDVSLDETLFVETVSPIVLKNVTIAQLYARGADFRKVSFTGQCVIVSFIADETTIVSEKMPVPSFINLPEKTLFSPEDKVNWFVNRFVAVLSDYKPDIRVLLERFPLFTLLHKIARTRSYWIKDNEEKASRRIFDDPLWPDLKEILEKHELLVVADNVGAGGRPGAYYHLKNRQGLLSVNNPPRSVLPFLQELVAKSYAKEKL